MPPSRRTTRPPAPPQPDLAEQDFFVDEPVKEDPPKDPAHVAVTVLLRHALVAAGTTVEEAGCDGSLCVVVVPSAP